MIRRAREEDRDAFGDLWVRFLLEQEKAGGDWQATSRTMGAFFLLFDCYTQQQRPGVCVLADDQAVVLWGAQPLDPMFDLVDGPVAFDWGVYVVPGSRGQGLSQAVRREAAAACREQGFRRVVGSVQIHAGVIEAALEPIRQIPAAASSLKLGFVGQRIQGSLAL